LWCLADREGRLEDRPKRIKASIFPYEDIDVDPLLTELESRSFLVRYIVDGKGFIQINNFLKHQNPHYKEVASEIPAPQEFPNVDSTLSQSQVNVDSSSGQRCTLIPDSLNLIPDSGFPHSIIKQPCEENVEKNKPDLTTPDVTEQEREILNIIKGVKGYKFDYSKDLEFLRKLAVDFPLVDIGEEVKKWEVWLYDHPLTKKSNPRSQIRNWLKNAVKFSENKENRNRNGPVDRRKMSFEDYMKEAMNYAPK